MLEQPEQLVAEGCELRAVDHLGEVVELRAVLRLVVRRQHHVRRVERAADLGLDARHVDLLLLVRQRAQRILLELRPRVDRRIVHAQHDRVVALEPLQQRLERAREVLLVVVVALVLVAVLVLLLLMLAVAVLLPSVVLRPVPVAAVVVVVVL